MCTSAGDRRREREERYHPSSPFMLEHVCEGECTRVRDEKSMSAEEVRVDFWSSIDTQRCFDILYGEAEGDRRQTRHGFFGCVCGGSGV